MKPVILRSLFFCFCLLSPLFFLPTSVHAAQTFDISNANNWNIRFDADSVGYLTHTGIFATDLDENGKADLIIPEMYASNNGRSHSGSVFIIYDSLLSKLAGKGNVIDLTNPANYNIRLDGAGPKAGSTSGDELGNGLLATDLDGDGGPDLILGAPLADNSNSINTGSVYVIYNSLLSKYSGTGNKVDMVDSNNWNIRFDGTIVSGQEQLGDYSVKAADISGSGYQDLLFSSNYGDSISHPGSGSLYLVYHSLFSSYSGTCNILSLINSQNFNLRIDGASSGDYFGANGAFYAADLRGTGKADLVVSSGLAGNNGRTQSGSVYVIYNNLLTQFPGTGNVLDTSINTNYNIRFDGAVASNVLGLGTVAGPVDLDGDGKFDLVIGAGGAGNNGRSNSGSLYVIYNSLLQSFPGVGETVDMSNVSNFNVRIDGPDSRDSLSVAAIKFADFYGTGKLDLLIGARLAGYNGRSDSGSFWIIKHALFSGYTSAGNLIDLADSSNWSLRYDGAAAGDWFSYLNSLTVGDLNNDGAPDILVGSNTANNNGLTSGSLWVVYNFPHLISLSSSGKDKIMGTVSAPNSVTSVSGVQYNYNSNDPTSSGWTNCSGTTSFTCTLSNFPSGSSNYVYIRAFDTNGSYTAQSSYSVANFTDGTSSGGGGSDPNCPWNFKYCITSGPHHQGNNVAVMGILGSSVFAADSAHHDDLSTQIFPRSTDDLSNQIPRIPFPWEQGFNTASDIFEVRVLSAFNGYPILILDNPATITFPYTSTNPNSLRIAYFDGTRWKILPNNTVIDWVNKTISNTTKIFNTYFVVGYPTYTLPTTPVLETSTTTQPETPTPETKPNPPTQKPISQPKPKTCFLWWCW